MEILWGCFQCCSCWCRGYSLPNVFGFILAFFNKEKHKEGEDIHINLAQEVSFLNKAAIKQTLGHLPKNSTVIISAKDTIYIDYDVLEVIKDFCDYGSKDKNITVVLKDFKEAYKIENTPESNLVS